MYDISRRQAAKTNWTVTSSLHFSLFIPGTIRICQVFHRYMPARASFIADSHARGYIRRFRKKSCCYAAALFSFRVFPQRIQERALTFPSSDFSVSSLLPFFLQRTKNSPASAGLPGLLDPFLFHHFSQHICRASVHFPLTSCGMTPPLKTAAVLPAEAPSLCRSHRSGHRSPAESHS